MAEFRLSWTDRQEHRVEELFGLGMETVVGMCLSRAEGDCAACPNCKIEIDAHEVEGALREDTETVITDVAVSCNNPDCPEPDNVQELGMELLHLTYQLHPLNGDWSIAQGFLPPVGLGFYRETAPQLSRY